MAEPGSAGPPTDEQIRSLWSGKLKKIKDSSSNMYMYYNSAVLGTYNQKPPFWARVVESISDSELIESGVMALLRSCVEGYTFIQGNDSSKVWV